MTVELYGLELYGYHGVNPDERRDGQRFVYDVWLEVGERGLSDRIEDAVDYRQVVACVREVNERAFQLLEALASALADELMARFALGSVRVRVRKPDVRLDADAVEFSAATAVRP